MSKVCNPNIWEAETGGSNFLDQASHTVLEALELSLSHPIDSPWVMAFRKCRAVSESVLVFAEAFVRARHVRIYQR